MALHPITKAIRTQTERTRESEHSTPLFLTSSFCFDNAEDMRAAFADETDDNIYSRFSNPSVNEFVDKMVDAGRRRGRCSNCNGHERRVCNIYGSFKKRRSSFIL
ncbi:MAG: PLP-dependent transferase [Chitinophagaceae bacterium]